MNIIKTYISKLNRLKKEQNKKDIEFLKSSTLYYEYTKGIRNECNTKTINQE